MKQHGAISGRLFRQAREALGLTQEDLGDALGILRESVADRESGRVGVRRLEAQWLRDTLGREDQPYERRRIADQIDWHLRQAARGGRPPAPMDGRTWQLVCDMAGRDGEAGQLWRRGRRDGSPRYWWGPAPYGRPREAGHAVTVTDGRQVEAASRRALKREVEARGAERATMQRTGDWAAFVAMAAEEFERAGLHMGTAKQALHERTGRSRALCEEAVQDVLDAAFPARRAER